MTGRRKLTEVGDGWVGARPPLTVDDLYRYADQLNATRFSRALGYHWRVGKRRIDEHEEQHFLTRDSSDETQPWKPGEHEAEATHAVVAELMAKGIEQREFSEMVRRGIVTRMVEQRLAQFSQRAPVHA